MSEVARKEDAEPANFEMAKFVEVGSIDVDAGSIWIGDGCYVLKDKDEERPKDLGDDWHGICERFFERSGYRAQSLEWSRWTSNRDRDLFTSPEWVAWSEKWDVNHPDTHVRGSECHTEKEAAIRNHHERFEKEHPYQPKMVDTGVAQFNHDLGHAGMGLMISTYYGDGSYPVYVEYGEERGRPRRVLIDFDPGGDEEDGDTLDDVEVTPEPDLVRGSPADIYRVLKSHYPELASGDHNIAPLCRRLSSLVLSKPDEEAA